MRAPDNDTVTEFMGGFHVFFLQQSKPQVRKPQLERLFMARRRQRGGQVVNVGLAVGPSARKI